MKLATLASEPSAFEKMWANDISSNALGDMLVKQFDDLDNHNLLKEITLQQKALARDSQLLSILYNRLDSAEKVLKVLYIDGATQETLLNYKTVVKELKIRHGFYHLVVEQRNAAINYGLDHLDRIKDVSLKNE
jgi:hypothetical protein